MEETIGVTSAAQIPKQRGESLLDTAVRYAEERHWDVFPGTWLDSVEGAERCSCGDTACARPGAHPAREDWATQATGSATVARRLWSKQPKASILLPTGRTFDAIDVPETAGFLALARMERMELTLGPVTCTPDRRMQFFVLPGATVKVPDLVRKLGWPPAALDLIALGEGAYVAAPPTRFGASGAVQWACRPTAANRWLPDAEEIISPLSYACGREGRRR
ncbi:bifunctional DNA primase/polymerase [Actinomycetota bacterium Odt1-20B]